MPRDCSGQGSADTIDTPRPTVQIHLRSLSTGNPHSLAANPILYLYDTHEEIHSLKCQIMGDTIGILFAQWFVSGTTMLSMWKWTTGEMLSVRSLQLTSAASLITAPQCSTHNIILSFAFVSDHAFVVPSCSSSGPCLLYYNFEPTHSSVQCAGTSTYAPRLDACFMLPDDDGSVVTTSALKIASRAPVISSQPHSSRRAGITRCIPLSKKFHSKRRSALVAMQSTYVGASRHFLLAVYANVFTDFVPREEGTVIPWIEWRDCTRIVIDPATMEEGRRYEFECNSSADRIVVIDQHPTSATVRVMDFNPIRFRSAISVSPCDSASDGHLAIDGSTRTSLVGKSPHSSDHWMKLALQGDGRGVGIPFLETTMSGAFPLGIGAIILDEHLLVLKAVSNVSFFPLIV